MIIAAIIAPIIISKGSPGVSSSSVGSFPSLTAIANVENPVVSDSK